MVVRSSRGAGCCSGVASCWPGVLGGWLSKGRSSLQQAAEGVEGTCRSMAGHARRRAVAGRWAPPQTVHAHAPATLAGASPRPAPAGAAGRHVWREEAAGQVQVAGGCGERGVRPECWHSGGWAGGTFLCSGARRCPLGTTPVLHLAPASTCRPPFLPSQSDCEDGFHWGGLPLLHGNHLHHHGGR